MSRRTLPPTCFEIDALLIPADHVIPALFAKMVNAAFKVSYRQPHIAPDFPRLESDEQILHELKPDVIIVLLTPVDDPATVLASVAAHPFHASSPEELKQMHPFALKWLVQPSEEDPQMPHWVLKQLCVARSHVGKAKSSTDNARQTEPCVPAL